MLELTFKEYAPHLTTTATIAVFVSLLKLIQWFYRQAKRREQVYDFVASMATNHLPHIYACLLAMQVHLGIVPVLPPSIESVSKEEK